MGLDKVKVYIYSAAPLGKSTHDYFLTLDMTLVGLYGMSETAATATTWDLKHSKQYSAGMPIKGMGFKIDNPDKDGVGEICMRGRPCFLGYYKNEKATREIYDSEGYVHSGDLGVLKDN